MPSTIDRRLFLRRSALAAGGLVLAGGATNFLAACGSDDDDSADSTTTKPGATGADFGKLTYQLSWIKNVEFAGQYLADTKGYYTDAGFESVNFLAGGPNVQQDAVVQAGKAFLGISSPDITAAAIKKGATLVAVGALFQKNPFCVMSLAENPINTVEDLIGKKVGVQAVNEPVWNAFLKANDIDPGDIEKVTAQFDPAPLVNKEVQGWFSFVTNEPNLLKVQGIDTVNLLLNDNKYPLVSQIYITKKETLEKERDKLKALLVADIKGWKDSLADPAAGAQLVIDKYGKDLDLTVEEQTLESEAQNKLIKTADTDANGIMTCTDEIRDESIATLALAGVDIKKEDLFDLSLLTEVYDENPDLKA